MICMINFEECPISGQLTVQGARGDYWIDDDVLTYVEGDHAGINTKKLASGSIKELLSAIKKNEEGLKPHR